MALTQSGKEKIKYFPHTQTCNLWKTVRIKILWAYFFKGYNPVHVYLGIWIFQLWTNTVGIYEKNCAPDVRHISCSQTRTVLSKWISNLIHLHDTIIWCDLSTHAPQKSCHILEIWPFISKEKYDNRISVLHLDKDIFFKKKTLHSTSKETFPPFFFLITSPNLNTVTKSLFITCNTNKWD